MKNVTERTSNPFGLQPPCDRTGSGERAAVFGYGDANADFHLIGDHPGVHGGTSTGVPFTETPSGVAIQDVVREIDFASGPADRPDLENLYCSYIHMCLPSDGETPEEESYADLERFFDAELRAINAHILLPVGERATDHVLREYTTQRRRLELDMATLHAKEVRGRGFLVVPIREPTEWVDTDRDAIRSRLEAILGRDYRQTKGVATRIG
ncbi:uracil-DNA glycosylase family protein [Natronolimnohabitans sp. A-GB9]|uniref:uracil-DNA glycosylase family protein n=1 Tax=Natronolimnohabitans sp. A-GB9 TaxID=3069757 RepID=UPI0027AF0254|nr:uracil-DNA glycosylase family protein [Natronolimnohabitans sp. A-GB9]MDQ2051315.1 uracil-DNA glycosylase family protein [Natronolimnohabitans sp. A-GB9]